MTARPDGLRKGPTHRKLIAAIVVIAVTFIVDPLNYESVTSNDNPEAFGTAVEHLSQPTVSSLEKKLRNYQILLSQTKEVYAEKDPSFVRTRQQFQAMTRELLRLKYGEEPYRVLVSVMIPNLGLYSARLDVGHIEANFTVQLAPIRHIPHAVHRFLETVSNFEQGTFTYITFHVLQAHLKPFSPLLFPEYSPEVPHLERTVGFSADNEFHISLMDNDHNLGPFSHSQSRQVGIATCLGSIIEGYETTVQQMRLIPMHTGVERLKNPAKHTHISNMTLLRR